MLQTIKKQDFFGNDDKDGSRGYKILQVELAPDYFRVAPQNFQISVSQKLLWIPDDEMHTCESPGCNTLHQDLEEEGQKQQFTSTSQTGNIET